MRGFRSGQPTWVDDARHEGPLPDLTSGLMWIATGTGGLLVLMLPGTQRSHLGAELVLGAFAIAWGAFSLYLGVRERTMSIQLRAVVTAAMMPVVALALWATGGAGSFLQPVLLFTALFIAYFFPPRLAWPLVAVFVFAFSTPLFYDGGAEHRGYPARVAVFALAVAGEALAMQFLKRRLLRAEAHQRSMAERDPLTGLHNRRAFDAALGGALLHHVSALDPARAGHTGLVLFDFNDFKAINDVHGHPVGDAVLRAVALAAGGVVRDGDCLARIGGDEFALVAPGAGPTGVIRLVEALDEAVRAAGVPEGIDPIRATFAWAIAPDDATDPAGLLELADYRLIERKRSLKALEFGLRESR
jgi:diguanylate cyclase (GGDEF)-like protein